MSRTPIAEKVISLSRTFDFPLDLVWSAWTEAKHVREWWGPRDFTNPVCEWDARPGGKILIHMRSPEGQVFEMPGEFYEVVPKEKIVFYAAVPNSDGTTILEGVATVTFEERDGKTHLTLHDKGVGFSEAATYMLDGMKAGWSESLDRMREHLGGQA